MPLGVLGAPGDAPDTFRGRLGLILGPPWASFWREFRPQNVFGDPKKRVKREREVERENLRERTPRGEERTRTNATKQKKR